MNRNDEWIRFIEQLKLRNDIVDVVGGYTNLERKGRLYWGCCPFHHEKTPSFTVNREGQFFKCFGGGCGAGGDIIKFVQDIESVDFMGAVEVLAKRAGLEIPAQKRDKQSQEKKQKKAVHLEICLEAARFYRSALLSGSGAHARKYLAGRGISADTVTKFGLGLSPDWESLPKHLQSKGFSLKDAEDAGVVSKKASYFDALGARLIVPVINAMGEVIAFGGRSFEAKPQFGKYVNTKQTLLFDKSKNLFGINLVKRKKQAEKISDILIVEGYMDVIALHQAGFDTAVASMGTALTREQAKLAKRYVDTVYICYDGDSAGKNATLKGLDVLKNESLDVRVMEIPDGMDPDEWIRAKGKDSFLRIMENALPLTDYKLKVIRQKYDWNNANKTLAEEAKRRYTAEALSVIGALDSLVEAESYLRVLQEQTGYSLDWIKREMVEGTRLAPPPVTVTAQNTSQLKPDSLTKAKYFVLSCQLYDEPFAKIDFRPQTADDEFLSSAFEYIYQCRAEDKRPVPSMLFDLFDGEYREQAEYILGLTFDTTLINQTFFEDCINLIKRDEIDRKIEELNGSYALECDLEKQKDILTEIQALMKEKKRLVSVPKKGEIHDF